MDARSTHFYLSNVPWHFCFRLLWSSLQQTNTPAWGQTGKPDETIWIHWRAVRAMRNWRIKVLERRRPLRYIRPSQESLFSGHFSICPEARTKLQAEKCFYKAPTGHLAVSQDWRQRNWILGLQNSWDVRS